MTYQQVKTLKPEEFKRLCGVRPETFKQMVELVREHSERKKKPGRPSKLGWEDQVLLTLEYWLFVPNLLSYRKKLGNRGIYSL
jgi:hypothetical protein